MKKIISLLVLSLIILGNINIVFGQANPTGSPSGTCVPSCDDTQSCIYNRTLSMYECQTNITPMTPIKPDTTPTTISNQPTTKATCDIQKGNRDATSQICCKSTETYDSKTKGCVSTTPGTTTPSGSVNGITINEECLTNGQCKFNIYDTLGIRKSVRSTDTATSVGLFVQDIVLSATFFIGTVVTIALIVSGLMYIFAAASGKDPSGAKKGIIGALIGLVLVACSYFIIRLIQYLAKGV